MDIALQNLVVGVAISMFAIWFVTTTQTPKPNRFTRNIRATTSALMLICGIVIFATGLIADHQSVITGVIFTALGIACFLYRRRPKSSYVK